MKLIDIYDTQDKKLVLVAASTKQVSKFFDKSDKYINKCLHDGTLIKNRFSLIDKGIYMGADFSDRWEDAVKPFRIPLKKKREKVG